MNFLKVVLRFKDGKIYKGSTHNFFPNKTRFHLFLHENPSEHPLEVCFQDLKAVFIVQDFSGKPGYNEQKKFRPDGKSFGPKMEVTFEDGKTLVGSSLDFSLKKKGFFLFPADPHSNNLKAFVIFDAVRHLRQLR